MSKHPITDLALTKTFDEFHEVNETHKHLTICCRNLETERAELLEALEAMMDEYLGTDPTDGTNEVVNKARALIAKVKGE